MADGRVASPSQDVLWSVISGATKGILATVGPDGLPHLTNVHYLADADGRVIRLTTTTTRAKGRNLLRDPRAALHVQGADWFTFAVASGPVEVAVAEQPGDAAVDELYELISILRGPAERPSFDDEMVDNDRMLVRIAVEDLYGLVPPGHRAR